MLIWFIQVLISSCKLFIEHAEIKVATKSGTCELYKTQFSHFLSGVLAQRALPHLKPFSSLAKILLGKIML